MAGFGWTVRVAMFLAAFLAEGTAGEVPADLRGRIRRVNEKGPYVGVVIPNPFEMNPLLHSPGYLPDKILPVIDYAGRRFRFGKIEGKKVVLVMTGLGMINAGVTTQLLLALFRVEGVVHYGIAGNANPTLMIGDVAVPEYWAHSALWSWQRNGNGPNDELPLEENGDYTRKLGFLKFSDYTTDGDDGDGVDSWRHGNLLNNVWYQPEEIFPVDGSPEERQHAFWIQVDPHFYNVSKKLQGLKLQRCVNSSTCLPREPAVHAVSRGMSASIYLDNAAYRAFLHDKFRLSPVDMESAAVALVCRQQLVPFIVIRALSDLAGGGSAESNEAATFITLAAANSITAVVEFIKLL